MLKKIYFSLVALLFAIALFLGVDRGFHRRSNYFSLSKVRRSNLFSSDLGTPLLSQAELENLRHILNQKFVLYDKGPRVYICVSEDGNYILKILKYQHLHPKSWFAHFPFSFNPYYQEFSFKKNKYRAILQSWKTAFTELREETGLIYMHTDDAQPLNQKVTILDKNVREHRVDLDKVIFCVQKHADLIYLRIAQHMHDRNLQEAKSIISSVFLLIDRLIQKGAIDDQLCSDLRLGLLKNEVIQINISKLHVHPILEHSSVYKEKVTQIMQPFKNWIDQNYPQLSSHFESCLEDIRKAD